MALSTYVLLSGHLLVTSTIDLLVWVTVTWLVLRILRGGDERHWLAVGAVTGLGFLNKQLPIVLLVGLLVGVLLTPSARHVLRSPWLWAGMAIAAAMWAPVFSGRRITAGHRSPWPVRSGTSTAPSVSASDSSPCRSCCSAWARHTCG